MIKVVIDTNVVISGIFWPDTAPDFVLNLISERKIVVVLSNELFTEIVEKSKYIVHKYKFSQKALKTWETNFKKYAHWVYKLKDIKVCRDPKDNMVLATALAGEAEYIVTGDKDLLDIKRYKGIKIVTANEFLKAL